ncbi:serpin family protein [Thermodesulfobacteriota bacterium]
MSVFRILLVLLLAVGCGCRTNSFVGPPTPVTSPEETKTPARPSAKTSFVKPPTLTSSQADRVAIARSINAFAFDLYGKVLKPGENVFLSPYSTAVALSMVYAGARGETANQMAKVLHFGRSREMVSVPLGDLNRVIVKTGRKSGAAMNLANAVWVQKGLSLLKEYERLLLESYGAGPKAVDFEGAPEASAREINEWAAKETKGRITDIVRPDSVSQAGLILANAIYFKAKWASQFDEKLTKPDDFTLLDGNKTRVEMMTQAEDFGYFEGEDFQVLEMPYRGDELSMVIFLPRAHNGLPEFEKSLTFDKMIQYLELLGQQPVHVYIPRFTMRDSLKLGKSLKDLRMTDAFDLKKADFSGMTGRRDLFIDKVIQKTFVDVKEEGTEAAAVTAVTVVTGQPPSSPPVIPTFRADHPFMFLIRHNKSGAILFMGRLVKP